MKKILIIILFLSNYALAQNLKISAMPSASTLTGSELIPVVQSGSNATATPTNLLTYTKSNFNFYNQTTYTASGTDTYTATIPSLPIVTDQVISVNFTNTNTITTPSLNINSTGAKTIQSQGAAVTAGQVKGIMNLKYDGTNWQLISGGSTGGGGGTTIYNGDASLTGPRTVTGSATNTLSFLFPSLGTTTTPDFILSNTTAAALGAQQNSPVFSLVGRGNGSTTVNADQEVRFNAYVQPVQAATNPTGNWILAGQINGGTVVPFVNISTAGTYAFTSNLTTNTYNFGTTGSIGSSIIVNNGSGEVRIGGNTGGFYTAIYSNGVAAINILPNTRNVALGTVTDNARLYITQSNLSSSWLPALRVDPSASTSVPATQEDPAFIMSAVTKTWLGSATPLATQRFNRWDAPTMAVSGGTGSLTVTDLINVQISAPIAGTGLTATKNWALNVTGNLLVGGTVGTTGSILADFQSSTLGVVLPRVTNIASITTPVNGMLAYDAATNLFNLRQNGSWIIPLATTGSGASLTNVVNSITGTTNQITANVSTGAVTLSLPSTVITSGTIQSTNSGGGQSAGFYVNSSGPAIAFSFTTGAADAKTWDILASTNILDIRAVNDANSAAQGAIRITRSGATISNTQILNGTFSVVNLSTAGVVTNTAAGLLGTVAMTLTPNATGFSVAGGTISKTLTMNNSLTFAGTDATVMTFPAASGTVATLNTAQTFTANQTINNTLGLGGDLTFSGANRIITTSGNVQLQIGGESVSSGSPTAIFILGKFATGTATSAGTVDIQGGRSQITGVKGGLLSLTGGQAQTGNADGGDVQISGATGIGTGKAGKVIIVGTTDGTSASTGQVGETITSTVSTYTNYTTTATYQQIATVALTAGDWLIEYNGTISTNSATLTANTNAIFLVGTTTASATGSTEGLNISYVNENLLSSTGKQSVSGNFNVSISSTTSYFLNSQATFTAGNPQFVGTIKARRMR